MSLQTFTVNPTLGAIAPTWGYAKEVSVLELSWGALRAQPGGTFANGVILLGYSCRATANTYGGLSRGHLFFDTTTLPTDIVIAGVSVAFNVTFSEAFTGSPSWGVRLISSKWSNNNTLANDAYDLTSFDFVPVSNAVVIGASGSYTFTFPDTGWSYINPGGYTKLGVVLEDDFTNTAALYEANRSMGITMVSAATRLNCILTVNYYDGHISFVGSGSGTGSSASGAKGTPRRRLTGRFNTSDIM